MPAPAPYLERGSRAYWRASLALLFAGYATFSLLYRVQPLLADAFSWRISIGVIGVLGLVAMLAFRTLLPPSRHFTPRRGLALAHHREALRAHLATLTLRALFAMAVVLMGCFVTLYNYVGYRLLAAPYNLNQTQIGAIFVVYLAGVVASPLSGRMADLMGRSRVLIASLLLMLAGSSLIGWYGGHTFGAYGWSGVTALVGALLILGIVTAIWLGSRERAGST